MTSLRPFPNVNFAHLGNKNFFRFKKFSPDEYLITNDIGSYCFLENSEFKDFLSGKLLSGKKYDELKNKHFFKEEQETEIISRYGKKNNFLGNGPSLHILVTTLRCNHTCQYCHASVVNDTAREYDMSIDTARRIVDTIFYTNSEGITIEFQGGESLLNFSVIEFVVYYAKKKAEGLGKDLSLVIVSNLTLLTEEMLNFFLQEGVDICTSLDGDEALHNWNRSYKYGNSFQQVTEKINTLHTRYQEVGKDNKVGALLTTTRFTLKRAKEIVDTYLSLGLDSLYIRPMNPYGFAANKLTLLGYTAEEFMEFYEEALDYILQINKAGTFLKEGYASIFLVKMLTERDPNFLDSRSPCGACIGQIAYNYDGKAYSCDEGRMFAKMGDDTFFLTDITENAEQNYINMINNDVTKCMVQASTLDGLPGYNDHVYKPYLGACPIYSYKSSGTIFSNFSKDKRTRLDILLLDLLFKKIQDPENLRIFQSWVGIKVQTDTFVCS